MDIGEEEEKRVKEEGKRKLVALNPPLVTVPASMENLVDICHRC